jgi:hypothetical protein
MDTEASRGMEPLIFASPLFAEASGTLRVPKEQAIQAIVVPSDAKRIGNPPHKFDEGKNGGDLRQLCRARSFKALHWPRACQKMEQECQARGLDKDARLEKYLAALSQHGAKDRGQKEALTRFFFLQDCEENIETVLCKNTSKMVEFRIIKEEPFLNGLVELFNMKLEGVKSYSQSRRTLNKAIKDWGFEPNARDKSQKFRPKWIDAYSGKISFIAI